VHNAAARFLQFRVPSILEDIHFPVCEKGHGNAKGVLTVPFANDFHRHCAKGNSKTDFS